MFYFIRFLVLFKYRKTENRPRMTEKNVNWNINRIHRQIQCTLHLVTVECASLLHIKAYDAI